jgi:lipoate-protein ligase A
MNGFRVVTRTGGLAELVAWSPPSGERCAALVHPGERGVVLGSTQAASDIDEVACRRGGYALARRNSGGGAVVIDAEAVVWLDLFVPSDDPLFARDVHRAGIFVGTLWAGVLRALLGDAAPIAVHQGGLVSTRWSPRICFAGLGPGEVTIGGKKVVGLSQRRTRAGASFFSLGLLAFDPLLHVGLAGLRDADARSLAGELAERVGVIDIAKTALEAALVAALSHAGGLPG